MIGFTVNQLAEIHKLVRQHEANVAARWAKRPSFLSRVITTIRKGRQS